MLSASHLPKMDTFGSCDPFCEVRFAGHTRRTAKVRNSYSPEWNARFRFQLLGASAATELELELFDWDLMRNEFIGRHVVPQDVMQRIACRPKGWRLVYPCHVWANGEAVVGCDRKPTTVTLAFQVLGSYSLQVVH